MVPKKKILLVDDDPLIVQTYQTEFELSNFEVFRAADGQSGFNVLKEKKPDVVLLDIIMPMMSGIDLLKKIKADPEVSETPVFILTNIGQDQAVEEALSNGAKDFILKYRYSPAEVVAKIRESV